MKARQRRLIQKIARVAIVCGVALFGATPAAAESTSYTYDALGRLRTVTRSDGTQTVYTYDAAGNRTEVLEALQPTDPASISVPATNTTGSYSISWTAPASGTVARYELYESTSSGFSSQTLAYNGPSLSGPIAGKGNGTYYYRVRACSGISCGAYRTGANPAVVTLPPGVPASISVPATSTTGTYTISWGTSTGTVTAYELFEATNSGFTSESLVYSGTSASNGLAGRGNGTYYYRVRACNGSACSNYIAGGNSLSVTLPPGIPASISVPTGSTTGSYTISWGTASGTLTAYELYEATNSGFTGQTLVYTGTSTSTGLAGRGNGTYYYRVRACNVNACSDYRPGGNSLSVTLPPGVPVSISVPSNSTNGSFTISWGTASGTLTAYELYEATNSSFTGQSLVYTGTSASTGLAGRGNGTYYYRVRACNGSACSNYIAGGNFLSVTLPPGTPASISVPAGSTTGSYTISWGTSTGTLTAYELYEATNSSFTGQSLVYTGTSTSTGLAGRGNGTYYYRARACNGSACSNYSAGSNFLSVTLPPGTPASITVPTNSTNGSFTISWGTASGTLTAYELYEATNSSFTGQSLVYTGTSASTGLVGRGNGTYYYRVRACNGSACSNYIAGSNFLSVTLPPGDPASISVPTGSTTGNYTISWGAASGTLTAYELYEATNSSFTAQTMVYSGASTSQALAGRGNGTYYYRVRACNGNACSNYIAGDNFLSVTLPPGTPASISVPAGSTTGSYTIDWGTSTGVVTAYELWEATNSAFSGATLIASTTETSRLITGRGDGTYYYRVRACNGSACSGYRTGSNPIAVSIVTTPATPTGLNSWQVADCAWSASWNASAGATHYRFRSWATSNNEWDVTGTSTTYNCPLGQPEPYRPRWVKACNAGGCSLQANFP